MQIIDYFPHSFRLRWGMSLNACVSCWFDLSSSFFFSFAYLYSLLTCSGSRKKRIQGIRVLIMTQTLVETIDWLAELIDRFLLHHFHVGLITHSVDLPANLQTNNWRTIDCCAKHPRLQSIQMYTICVNRGSKEIGNWSDSRDKWNENCLPSGWWDHPIHHFARLLIIDMCLLKI